MLQTESMIYDREKFIGQATDCEMYGSNPASRHSAAGENGGKKTFRKKRNLKVATSLFLILEP